MKKRTELQIAKERNAVLMKRLQEAREQVEAHEQIAKMHSAYIALLLERLNADKDHPVELTQDIINKAMVRMEARASVPEEGKFCMYYAELDQ